MSIFVAMKLVAVEVAEKNSNKEAARQLKVDPQGIHEWCAQKKLVQLKEISVLSEND